MLNNIRQTDYLKDDSETFRETLRKYIKPENQRVKYKERYHTAKTAEYQNQQEKLGTLVPMFKVDRGKQLQSTWSGQYLINKQN